MENQKDLDAAKENGLSEAMVDRLRLTHERIDGMAKGLRELIELPDPVGVLNRRKRTAQWIEDQKSEGSNRCDWNHLRIPSQCDD